MFLTLNFSLQIIISIIIIPFILVRKVSLRDELQKISVFSHFKSRLQDFTFNIIMFLILYCVGVFFVPLESTEGKCSYNYSFVNVLFYSTVFYNLIET